MEMKNILDNIIYAGEFKIDLIVWKLLSISDTDTQLIWFKIDLIVWKLEKKSYTKKTF